MFAAIAAVSLASCGNKAADAAKAEADSIRIADSLEAVEAAAAEAAAAIDTVEVVDSVAGRNINRNMRTSICCLMISRTKN